MPLDALSLAQQLFSLRINSSISSCFSFIFKISSSIFEHSFVMFKDSSSMLFRLLMISDLCFAIFEKPFNDAKSSKSFIRVG